jgi:hypothetical protein
MNQSRRKVAVGGVVSLTAMLAAVLAVCCFQTGKEPTSVVTTVVPVENGVLTETVETDAIQEEPSEEEPAPTGEMSPELSGALSEFYEMREETAYLATDRFLANRVLDDDISIVIETSRSEEETEEIVPITEAVTQPVTEAVTEPIVQPVTTTTQPVTTTTQPVTTQPIVAVVPSTTVDSRGAMVSVAKSQVGVSENGENNIKYNTWYYGHTVLGRSYGWCVVFLAWCADQAGVSSTVIPHYAGVSMLASYYQKQGNYYTVSSGYQPSVGDIAFFNSSHVGLVVEITDTYLVLVEGNYSDKVSLNSYPRSTYASYSAKITAFASPNYEG